MVFGADIIAGFPTETEAMFGNSLKLVEECGLTYLHVFPFSPRPGTPASRMPKLPKPVVQDRARSLREKGKARLDAFLEAEIGAVRSILIETEFMGRTEHFAPVKFAQRMSAGAIVGARVTGRGSDHLQASLAA
jgi:threonylcarbamoyladenosine tRNA methylthiotransferase MtaB